MKINLTKYGKSDHRWINYLIVKFAEEFDTKISIVRSFIDTSAGAKAFCVWLNNEGFKVKFWCWEPIKTGSSGGHPTLEFIGFGLDFDDTCEKFIEVKLRT
jgi:hypothetical protein